MFIDRLVEEITKKDCNIVVGLDPRLESIPEGLRSKYTKQYGETLKAVGEMFYNFNKGIIDSVYDIVPAVKPQIAFYEMYGVEGLNAYKKTCEYAKQKGLIVVGDVKRGDIGSTSRAYSTAFLGKSTIGESSYNSFYSDSITINPYLGDDCIKEFIDDMERYNKGIFILVKTSNPSSDQIQNIISQEKPIYEHVAGIVRDWGVERIGKYGYNSVGAVVGATYPETLKRLRKLMPATFFLVPGYGAQGAGAEDIKDSFNDDGLGSLINSSRGIIFAYKKEEYKGLDYMKAARQATLDMKQDINRVLKREV